VVRAYSNSEEGRGVGLIQSERKKNGEKKHIEELGCEKTGGKKGLAGGKGPRLVAPEREIRGSLRSRRDREKGGKAKSYRSAEKAEVSIQLSTGAKNSGGLVTQLYISERKSHPRKNGIDYTSPATNVVYEGERREKDRVRNTGGEGSDKLFEA